MPEIDIDIAPETREQFLSFLRTKLNSSSIADSINNNNLDKITLDMSDEQFNLLQKEFSKDEPIGTQEQKTAPFENNAVSDIISDIQSGRSISEFTKDYGSRLNEVLFKGPAPALGISGEQLAEKQPFGDRPIATALAGTAIDTASEIYSPLGIGIGMASKPIVAGIKGVGQFGKFLAETPIAKTAKDKIAATKIYGKVMKAANNVKNSELYAKAIGFITKERGLDSKIAQDISQVNRELAVTKAPGEELAKKAQDVFKFEDTNNIKKAITSPAYRKAIEDTLGGKTKNIIPVKDAKLALIKAKERFEKTADEYAVAFAEKQLKTAQLYDEASQIIAGRKTRWKKYMPIVNGIRKELDTAADTLIKHGKEAGIIKPDMEETILKNKGAYIPYLYDFFENPNISKVISKQAGRLQVKDLFTYIKNENDGLLKDISKYASKEHLDAMKKVITAANNGDESAVGLLRSVSDTLKSAADKRAGLTLDVGSGASAKSVLLHRDADAGMRAFLGEGVPISQQIFKGTNAIQDLIKRAKVINILKESGNIRTFENGKAIPSGWFAIPKNERYGIFGDGKHYAKMAEKLELENYFNNITSFNNYPKIKQLVKANTMWKIGKVLLSPAAMARNLMSTPIIMDAAGTSISKIPELTKRAISSQSAKDADYIYLKNSGLLNQTYSNIELKNTTDYLLKKGKSWSDIFFSGISNYDKVMKNIYSKGEGYFRTLRYYDNLANGMTREAAVRDAENTLINYRDVAPILDIARKIPIGLPFITFSAKMIPMQLETMAKRPMTIYKWYSMIDNWNRLRAEQLGFTEEDLNTLDKNKYQKSYIIVDKNKDGSPKTLDMSYILPWNKNPEEALSQLTLGGLLSGPIAGAMSIVDKETKDPFTKKQIAGEGAELRDISQYVLRGLAPEVPGVPYSRMSTQILSKIYNEKDMPMALRVLYGEPNVTAKKLSWTEIAAGIGGLKITPQEIPQIKAQAYREYTKLIEKIDSEIKKEMMLKADGKPANIVSEKVHIKIQERDKAIKALSDLQSDLRANRESTLEKIYNFISGEK